MIYQSSLDSAYVFNVHWCNQKLHLKTGMNSRYWCRFLSPNSWANISSKTTVPQDSADVAAGEMWKGEHRIVQMLPTWFTEAKSLTGLAEPQESTFSHLPTEIIRASHHAWLSVTFLRHSKTISRRLYLLRQEICMIVVIWQFIQERPGLQNKCRKNHPGQVHAGTNLFEQSPDKAFVFFRHSFRLRSLTCL